MLASGVQHSDSTTMKWPPYQSSNILSVYKVITILLIIFLCCVLHLHDFYFITGNLCLLIPPLFLPISPPSPMAIISGISILFSIVAAPICYPTNSSWGFHFLHILTNTCVSCLLNSCLFIEYSSDLWCEEIALSRKIEVIVNVMRMVFVKLM